MDIFSDTDLIPRTIKSAELMQEFLGSFDEGLREDHSRRKYFQNLCSDDFIGLVQRFGSVIREGGANSFQQFDGGKGSMTLEAPDILDSEALLRDTWDAARMFLSNTTISDKKALEKAAVVVGAGIIITHPFIGANGRVSSLLSYLIAHGIPTRTITQELAMKSFQDDIPIWDPSPYSVNLSESDVWGREATIPEIDWRLPQPIVDTLENDDICLYVANSPSRDTVLRRFIWARYEQNKAVIDSHTGVSDSDEVSLFNAMALLRDLTNDREHGVSNSIELNNILRTVKREKVTRLLGMLRSTIPVPIYQKIQSAATGEVSVYKGMRPETYGIRRLARVSLGSLANPEFMPVIDQLVLITHMQSRQYLEENGFTDPTVRDVPAILRTIKKVRQLNKKYK